MRCIYICLTYESCMWRCFVGIYMHGTWQRESRLLTCRGLEWQDNSAASSLQCITTSSVILHICVWLGKAVAENFLSLKRTTIIPWQNRDTGKQARAWCLHVSLMLFYISKATWHQENLPLCLVYNQATRWIMQFSLCKFYSLIWLFFFCPKNSKN